MSRGVQLFRKCAGVPSGISGPQLTLLLSLALAFLFEEYDLAMLTSALKYIAADFKVDDRELGSWLGIIRLGSIPAFFIVPIADRIGRKKVFIASVAGMGVLTFLTGFTQNIWQFVAVQASTRIFFVCGSAVGVVIISEELPAQHRGWGVGLVGAIGAVGYGIEALAYSQIARLPYTWRALYCVGILPVLILPLFLKSVPETNRFVQYQIQMKEDNKPLSWVGPMKNLLTQHCQRAAAVAVIAFLPSFGFIAAFQFTGFYTQKTLGWSPGEYSAMVVVGGALGLAGNLVAGIVGDRVGRKKTGALLLSLFPVWTAMFYRSSTGWMIVTMWIGFVFCSTGGRVILKALSTEVFPTSHRSTASGWFQAFDALGSASGLFCLSTITHTYGGSVSNYIPLQALTLPLGGLCMLIMLPETSQRELEEIV